MSKLHFDIDLDGYAEVHTAQVEKEVQDFVKRKLQREGQLTPYSPEELKRAEELLLTPGCLDTWVNLTDQMGHAGEVINKKALALATVSRLGDTATSIAVRGESAVGKNALVNSILSTLPPSVVKTYTDLSPQVLFHLGDDLSHMVLHIREAKGGEKADYLIRSSLSERELCYLVTEGNPAIGFRATEKRIGAEGLVYIETTVHQLEAQKNTRLLTIYPDNSPEQTRRVLLAEAKRREIDIEAVRATARVLQAAQSLLKPIRVVILTCPPKRSPV